MPLLKRYCIVLTVFMVTTSYSKVIAQSDTLITKQGDVLYGSIEGLSEGILLFKTPYAASELSLKWVEVASIASKKQFVVFDKKTHIITGFIRMDSLDKVHIYIATKDSIIILDKASIVSIGRYVNSKLSERLKLRADIGMTLAKANKSASLSFSVNGAYSQKRWEVTLDYLSYALIVDSVLTGRGNITVGLKYLLPNNWFIIAQAGDFYSTEQQVDSRENIYLGFGKFIVRRNKNFLLVYAGGTYNREKFSRSPEYFKTAEAFITTRSEFAIAKVIDLINDLSLLPSLTDHGRVRFNSGTDLKFTFAKHFSCGLGFVLNADSKPPVTSAKADYIINFKLGWKL